ncbi:MAG: sugar nucleotide-binding protein [Thermoleophilia bacterium]|nr:sugar nucleotide-binding protein [Thermoleophilia bacterium]
MARILVVGASGYVGRELCRVATAAGHDVVGTRLRGTPAPGDDARVLDVTDAAAVRALMAAVRPDVVVNTAYMQDPPHARPVNVGGAGHVAAAAATAGARLVHVSSDVVFGGTSADPLREDAVPSPVHDYGRTKADGERAVAAAHPGAAIVRTSLVYGGPDGPASRHERVALEAARGERDMAFFSDELRCPAQVTDLAAAMLALAATGHAGPIHLVGWEVVSRHAFAVAIAQNAGADVTTLRAAPCPPGRPAALVLDGTLARRLLPSARLRGVSDVFGPAGYENDE